MNNLSGLPTSENLIAWADKIDEHLNPISGHDADALAVLLRKTAVKLAGIPHPTGSEQFIAEITKLFAPPPWRLCDEEPGEVLGEDGTIVLTIDRSRLNDREAGALALWVIMAINTLSGFKMESAK